MALSTTKVVLGERYQHIGMLVPTAPAINWQTIIAAPGPATADNGGSDITNPTTQITRSVTSIYDTCGIGQILLLRLAYDNTLTVSTDPVVTVFGRVSSSDSWALILNKVGGLTTTLATNANDGNDGTYKYTIVEASLYGFPMLGCREFLVGIKTALAGSVGSATTAFIQAKVM